MKYIIDIHDTGLNMTPYTEPDRKGIEDEVWEFTGKIQKMTGYQMHDILGIPAQNYDYFCNEISYQEAKAKYEAWKKQKNEIRVGYGIYNPDIDEKGVITHIENPNTVDILWYDGSVSEDFSAKKLQKTGEVFPEIIDFLAKRKIE